MPSGGTFGSFSAGIKNMINGINPQLINQLKQKFEGIVRMVGICCGQ